MEIGPRACSSATVPEGKCELRFEFDPTGQPDIATGKGALRASPGGSTALTDALIAE
jgi:hypothetical protein